MKLQLKPFQENGVAELRRKAERARDDVPAVQALLLNAPTGAGKTVMAAALLESLLLGDGTYDGDPEATFLWITDQPELNEQTKEKFLAASDQFVEDRIEMIEAATFDQEMLEAGKLYFLNTQKLGRTSGLVRKGDGRAYSMWETIANTARSRPRSLWLILDEAHRGMGGRTGNGEAATIIQRLILGSPENGVDPIPLIFGISATPGRFTALLDKDGSRDRLNVSINPGEVRASGLLKATIALYHTDEDQPSDISLLAAAAEQLKEYEAKWAQHHATNPESDLVRPVLVVQVEDGTKQRLSRTNLVQAIEALKAGINDLGDDHIAHAFQDQIAVEVGGTRVRYLKPSAIESDPDVRVVFFKQSLTTGWDCPKAEVMMSFRRAKDETLIAQLVGRMVRTPLAFAVTDPELLSSVALYLPQYDAETVESVIARLQTPNPDDGIPGTATTRGNTQIELRPNPELREVLDALTSSPLPCYQVVRVAKLAPIRRLLRLGDRLAWDGLDKDAKRRHETALLTAIAGERQRLAKLPDYKDRLKDVALINIRQHDVELTTEDGETKQTTSQVAAAAFDIDRAFAQAGRKLAAGLQTTYLKARAAEDQTLSPGEIKRELWVVVADNAARATVEKVAEDCCEAELKKFGVRIDREVSEESRAEYRAIRQMSAEAQSESWLPGEGIFGAKDGEGYDHHLYVNGGGVYKASLNGLEKDALAAEANRDDYIGFLRNEPRKPWAFSLAYETGGERKAMYPDFLIFRKDAGHIVTDILEPHSLSHADSVPKVKGMADFAEKHGEAFGRIEFVDKIGGQLKRIDLKDSAIRKRAKTLEGSAQLKQLLENA